MSLGYFAGGLAQGLQQGHRMQRDQEREKREKEDHEYKKQERQREEGVRTASRNTFGNVGQEREDGSTYTDENAYDDYSRQVAGLDPERAHRAKVEGRQLGRLKRQEEGEKRIDTYMEFMRKYGQAPDEVFFPEAAKWATQNVPDGKAFGVSFDPNEGWKATMVGPDGSVQTKGITSRDNFARGLQRYLSPEMMQAADAANHRDRQFGLQRDSLEETKRYHAGSLEEQRRRTEVMDRHYQRADENTRRYRESLTGNRAGGLRNPEQEIYLRALGTQEKSLVDALSDPNTDPSTRGQIQQHLKRVRRQQYDLLVRDGVLPKDLPRWQFMQQPEPISAAQAILANPKMRDPMVARQALDAFRQEYGGDPSAAEALNGFETWVAQMSSVVRPETAGPGLSDFRLLGPNPDRAARSPMENLSNDIRGLQQFFRSPDGQSFQPPRGLQGRSAPFPRGGRM